MPHSGAPLLGAVAGVLAALLGAGCYHTAEFRRDGGDADVPAVASDAFATPARVEVLPFTGGTQYEKHALFLQALRGDARVELLGSSVPPPPAAGEEGAGGGGDPPEPRRLEDILAERERRLERRAAAADYVLLYDCRVEAGASGSNFLICFPGFLVFMPAWYGLVWNYDVVTKVEVCRGDGARVTTVEARDEYTAYHTSTSDGINLNLGFTGFFPAPFFGFIFPFTEAIVASVRDPDLYVLDRAFQDQMGPAYGEAMKVRVLAALGADLRGEPPAKAAAKVGH